MTDPSEGTTHSSRSADPALALARLVRYFRALERTFSGLEVGESRWLTRDDHPADVEAGVLVTYHPPNGDGEARVWVSPRRVKLKARWEADGGFSELEERFTVDLDDGPTWAATRFESMGEFAAALVGLMRRRLSDLPVSPGDVMAPPAHTQIPVSTPLSTPSVGAHARS